MMSVKTNAANRPVRTPPMAASLIAGADSEKGLIERAYEPTSGQSDTPAA
jgi:hypothetical protein